MIFANFANALNASMSGGSATPAPVTYSAQPAYSAPAPVRNTTPCYSRRNACWNACHPPNFGQDVDYSAVSRCENNCNTEFTNCTN